MPSMQTQFDAARVRQAAERARKRLWAVCYRMTGNRTEADELCQVAIARAIEATSAGV
jgi:DNA-directed RNA polymerase specialized sigma24 family protein